MVTFDEPCSHRYVSRNGSPLYCEKCGHEHKATRPKPVLASTGTCLLSADNEKLNKVSMLLNGYLTTLEITGAPMVVNGTEYVSKRATMEVVQGVVRILGT